MSEQSLRAGLLPTIAVLCGVIHVPLHGQKIAATIPEHGVLEAQEIPVDAVGSVELMKYARFESDLTRLRELELQITRLLGSSDWADEDMLFSFLEEIDLEGIVAASEGFTPRVVYDLYLTVPLSGSDDYSMAVVCALPRSAFSDEGLGLDIEALKPDADGFAASPDDEEVMFLFGDETIFLMSIEDHLLTDKRQLLLDAREDFIRNPPRDAFSMSLTPQDIRASLRKPFVDQIVATLSAAVQKRDQEDELQFRAREFWGKSVAKFIDMIANQVESIRYSLNFRSADAGIEITLKVKVRKNSRLDSWLNEQSRGRSGVVRYLHPAATCSGMINIALPEVWKETWPPLAAAAADALHDAGLISSSAAYEMSSTVSNIVAWGRLELLVQFVPDGKGSYCCMICTPLRDSPDFSNAAIELVSLVEDDSLQVTHTEIDGWPLHQISGEMTGFLPGADTIQMIVTGDAVMISLGPPTVTQLMESVVRRDFESPAESDHWRRRGFAMQTDVISLMQILDVSDDEDYRQYVMGQLDPQTVATSDNIQVLMHQEPQLLEISATFDNFASPFALRVYSGFLQMLLEGADF